MALIVVMAMAFLLLSGAPTSAQKGCTYTIKTLTGDFGSGPLDRNVDLRVYGCNGDVLDLKNLDNVGADDFEPNQVDVFTLTGRRCLMNICAAKFSVPAGGKWSLETVKIEVSDSSGDAIAAFVGVYGETIESGNSAVVPAASCLTKRSVV